MWNKKRINVIKSPKKDMWYEKIAKEFKLIKKMFLSGCLSLGGSLLIEWFVNTAQPLKQFIHDRMPSFFILSAVAIIAAILTIFDKWLASYARTYSSTLQDKNYLQFRDDLLKSYYGETCFTYVKVKGGTEEKQYPALSLKYQPTAETDDSLQNDHKGVDLKFLTCTIIILTYKK